MIGWFGSMAAIHILNPTGTYFAELLIPLFQEYNFQPDFAQSV
jgi:hypothetical protein